MIRVLIVDDHAVVRRGLKQILSGEPDMRGLGEAENGQQALELARKQEWDVVILDIGLPGRGGLETLKDLKAQHPGLPVLILSMHPEDRYAIRALRSGASGYLTKERAPEELVKAIRKVLAGRKYINQRLFGRHAGWRVGG